MASKSRHKPTASEIFEPLEGRLAVTKPTVSSSRGCMAVIPRMALNLMGWRPGDWLEWFPDIYPFPDDDIKRVIAVRVMKEKAKAVE